MTASWRTRAAGLGWLLAVTLLLWLYSLATLRMPHQNDTLVHLRWAEQFAMAMSEGWLLPRWASASLGGLGDPTLLYYQPLFYYISSTFAALGLRSEYALLCAAMVPFLLLGAVVYLVLLRQYRNGPALLGATFIVACPVPYFVAANMGAFPWALSLPFGVLFVVESARQCPRIARLAVLLCLICLSHMLSGLMALAAVGLARLFFAFPKRENFSANLHWAAGVALGLALAGFFLYPAITQLHLINPDGWVHGTNFDWRRAFAFPTFTLAQYGYRWFAIQMPFALVTLVLCIVVLGPFAGAPDTPGKLLARRLAQVALAAMALGSELAYPLYALVGPMQKLQFPYRFVLLALLLANIALVIALNEGAWSRWRTWLRAAVVGLVLAQVAIVGHLQFGQYKSGTVLPAKESFMTGRFGQPEYVPAVRGPEWKQYLESGGFSSECARLQLVCSATSKRTHDFASTIAAPSAVQVRLPLLAFPAWGVTVDGQAVPLQADPATGLVLVTLAPGTHRVGTQWQRMPAEKIGWGISGAAVLLLAALTLAAARRRRRATPAPALSGGVVPASHVLPSALHR